MRKLGLAVAVALAAGTASAKNEGPCSPEREIPAARTSAPQPVPRVRLGGQKYVGRQLQRSEAGLSWTLGSKVTLELNYARSALAPMMPHDHEDGILTRLKLGF